MKKTKTRILNDPFNGAWDTIRAGARIGFVTGPGERPTDGEATRTATVYERKVDRWGRYLRVKRDDFTFDTVHGLAVAGIGAYLIAERGAR